MEIYTPMQASINIPDIMDDIHPTMVPKMAIPPNEMVNARKNFLERMGPINRRITSRSAGLSKRIAGFHMINEPGNLNGADTKSIPAIETTANEA